MTRTVPAFACVVCLQAITWACSSRSAVPGTAASPPVNEPSTPTAIVTPADPAASTAITSDTGPDECGLTAAPGEPIATIGLSNRVDPLNAPHPSNDAEQLLFRQLYETLVRVDCMGRVGPSLAASWRVGEDTRTWIVTLRENARFSDGSQVRAADVQASWAAGSGGDALRLQVRRLVRSVVPVSDRVLAITLRSGHTDSPRSLAHPDLAVAKFVAGSAWPVGSRSASIATDVSTGANGSSVIALVTDSLPALRFLVAPGDPRDLLDRGIDLLITRDPATLDYAASLPPFQSVPLAWQRTHVLLTPGRLRTSPMLAESERQSLAADAVRGDARGATGPFWWQSLLDCEIARSSPSGQSAPVPRIVYDAEDLAARDLSERLVGLVGAPGRAQTSFLDALFPDRPRRTYQRATGLTGAALATALRRGTDAGYIVSVDRRPLDPCLDLQALMERAPWLDAGTMMPLIDTRVHAIVRRERSGVRAEWDGGLIIAPTARFEMNDEPP